MSDAPQIFTIEDDDSLREGIGSLLRSVGYAVEGFASAENFLRSGQVAEADCLILDVKMPGMSGLELQRWLNKHGSGSVPVIFISAHDDRQILAEAMAGGGVEFLRKPFNDESLLKAIKTALEPPLPN